jgi:hypothetical protein
MRKGNSEKRINSIKKGAKNFLKFGSFALLCTLAMSLSATSAEAKTTKLKPVKKQHQKTKSQVQSKKDVDKAKAIGKPADTASLDLKTKQAYTRVKRFTNLLVMVDPAQPVNGSISPRVISKSGIVIFGDHKTAGAPGKKDTIAKFAVNKGVNQSEDTSMEYIKINKKEKPLVIKSIGTIKQNGEDYLIISDTDALKILIENRAAKFLESAKVAFLQDKKPEMSESPYGNMATEVKTIETAPVTTAVKPADASPVTTSGEVKPSDATTITTTGEVKPADTQATPEVKPAETTVATEVKSPDGFTVKSLPAEKPDAMPPAEMKKDETPAASPGNSSASTGTQPAEVATITINDANLINKPAENNIPEASHSLKMEEPALAVPPAKNIILNNAEKYTSLIIDCSQLGLIRGMSPVVLTPDEYELYPSIIVDGLNQQNLASVMSNGLVTYANSLADAKNNKIAGKNPLVIRASDVKGILKTDAVIDPVDAAKLIMVNEKSNILDERKVILIY